VAFTANDYITEAAELYGDESKVRVDNSAWIRHLNAAIRTLILARPDAGAVVASVQLVAGVKQTLPTAALRLLDIIRNMGADGLTAGAIVTPSDRQNINYSNLLWPAGTGETYIENFSYDYQIPRIFYVTPPVSSTTNVYVEMATSQLPTAITATGDDDGIEDIFFEAIVQFMLYKALSVDDENVEFQKAQVHFQNFTTLLGVEVQSSRSQGPEGKE
jgi:hypothetical protein